ncbi:DUF58 domain-containing protein [Streptomyces sp. NPDC059680]|uniref:DUF58 domain-containing protein n=1 Tax=Streptomyces sp. NPDC059680 TaxID=3346904 RepID=UPI0036BBE56A
MLATSIVLAYGAVLFASPVLGLVAVAELLSLILAVLSTVTAARPTALVSLDATTVRRGSHVTVRMRVRPTGLLLRAGVALDSTGFESDAMTVIPAAAVEPTETSDDREDRTISLRATRHGEMTVGPVVLTQTDLFGLCRRVTRTSEATPLLVRPAVIPIARMQTYGRVRSSVGGRGTKADRGELDTLRPYEVGDDIRLIHWPNSGRTGEILVRRHVTPPTPEIFVLHDTTEVSYAALEIFEEAVDFSASVVAAVTADGLAMRLGTTSSSRVRTWSAGDRCTDLDIARSFVSIQPHATVPGAIPGGPFGLGQSAHGALVGAAACTMVTSEPRPELLRMLRESAFPSRLTLVCIGPRRPDEAVERWALARGASLIDAPDARGAIAQWALMSEAFR